MMLQLLDNLLLLPEAKIIFDNYLGDEYTNLMYYDKLEEVFVKLISEVLETKSVYSLSDTPRLDFFTFKSDILKAKFLLGSCSKRITFEEKISLLRFKQF